VLCNIDNLTLAAEAWHDLHKSADKEIASDEKEK